MQILLTSQLERPGVVFVLHCLLLVQEGGMGFAPDSRLVVIAGLLVVPDWRPALRRSLQRHSACYELL